MVRRVPFGRGISSDELGPKQVMVFVRRWILVPLEQRLPGAGKWIVGRSIQSILRKSKQSMLIADMEEPLITKMRLSPDCCEAAEASHDETLFELHKHQPKDRERTSIYTTNVRVSGNYFVARCVIL